MAATVYDFGTRKLLGSGVPVRAFNGSRLPQGTTAIKQLSFYFPPLNCPGHRLPVHGESLAEDGRSGFQILKSATAYLEFCAGFAWRPASHRYHPTRQYFLDGIRVLMPIAASFAQCRASRDLFFYDDEHGQAQPARDLFPQKKPSQSVPSTQKAKAASCGG